MARSGTPADDDGDAGGTGEATGNAGSTETADWFAESALRIGLAILGLVLVLFAVGMATGVDVLGALTEFFTSWVGRWLLVAVVGLAIVALALHGFGPRGE